MYRTVLAGVSSLSPGRSASARGALAVDVESRLSGGLAAQSCAQVVLWRGAADAVWLCWGLPTLVGAAVVSWSYAGAWYEQPAGRGTAAVLGNHNCINTVLGFAGGRGEHSSGSPSHSQERALVRRVT